MALIKYSIVEFILCVISCWNYANMYMSWRKLA